MFSELSALVRAPLTLPRVSRVKHVFAVWRSRRALGRLDPARLSDIGVSRNAADAEARRPLWDVPDNWHR